MRLRSVPFVLGCLVAMPAWADNANGSGELNWSGGLTLAPAISGVSLFDLDRDRSDSGEYSAYAKASTKPVLLDQQVYVQAGLSYAPQLFQKRPAGVAINDPTSSGYLEVGLGDKWRDIRNLERPICSTPTAYQPARWGPYINYRHSRTMAGFVGEKIGHSNRLVAGVRLADVKQCAVTGAGGEAELAKYLNYVLRAQFTRDWTSDAQKANTALTAQADFSTKRFFKTPGFSGVQLNAAMRGDRIAYTNARPSGLLRRDWRWRLSGGLGTTLAKALGTPNLGFEVRREWLRSNDATQRRSGTQVSASLAWQFGKP